MRIRSRTSSLHGLAPVLIVAIVGIVAIVVDREVRAQEEAPAPVAEAVPAPDSSVQLKENLRETIEEGEKILRSLPRARIGILRSRISNLERQLKRKEKERKELQDSLALLRADFYTRLSAVRRNEGVAEERVLREQEARLRDDYDLHAQSFEEELGALGQDVVEIQRTIEDLRSQSIVAESLRPRRLAPADATPTASDRLLEIPQRLNPFEVKSYTPRALGRRSAPPAVLWGLKGEIAFRRGDLDTAERYWSEALGKERDLEGVNIARYNLAHTAYARGDFRGAYARFVEILEGEEIDRLTPDDAYTLAVLAYLNGLIDDARTYLLRANETDRQRMEEVLGPIGGEPGVDS